jgi:hypothetical protein
MGATAFKKAMSLVDAFTLYGPLALLPIPHILALMRPLPKTI